MARLSGPTQPAGLGKTATGLGGKGLGKSTAKRHRRLARRGGVKRISATIYDEVRAALKDRLKLLLHDICAILECTVRKTITVPDVVFVLNRHGTPIYGFDTPFRTRK
ncbi:MAG: Bet v1-like protein [Aureobasidium pullulans]|nr:MAG: Bet v1-like protein [Aureobasidium pullulans]